MLKTTAITLEQLLELETSQVSLLERICAFSPTAAPRLDAMMVRRSLMADCERDIIMRWSNDYNGRTTIQFVNSIWASYHKAHSFDYFTMPSQAFGKQVKHGGTICICNVVGCPIGPFKVS